MSRFNFFNPIFGQGNIHGTDKNDLIFGSFHDDHINAKDGDDIVFGLFGDDKIAGGLGNDLIFGGAGKDIVQGGDGEDELYGGSGDDIVVGNKGDDAMYGGHGNDMLVWNNGDGSDLMDGGKGYDVQQVNFDTDLVNNDLQNDDVAEFSVTHEGIQFARVELNGQSVNGLFELDIRNTEVQETNFGGGDDTAVIKGNVLNEIKLDLDGGDGVDTLDFGHAAGPISVDLETGSVEIDNGAGQDASAVNFENVIGTDSNDVIYGNAQDNVIRGGAGDDIMTGGEGADTFVFFEEDLGVDVILDFEFGVDKLEFVTTDPDVTAANLMGNLTQVGDDVEIALNNKVITFEDTVVTDFSADDFLIV